MEFSLNFFVHFILIIICQHVYFSTEQSIPESAPPKLTNLVDWAFSPILVAALAREEREIYKLVLNYRDTLKGNVLAVGRYIKEYEESTPSFPTTAGACPEKEALELEIFTKQIAAHPFMTLRMFRRFTLFLPGLVAVVPIPETGVMPPFLQKLYELDSKMRLPTPVDVFHVMDSIIRIQNVYDLNARDLFHGIIGMKNTTVGLTILDAYQIAKHALATQVFPEALNWFRIIVDELNIKPNVEIGIVEVLANIERLVQEHDALHSRITPENYLQMNPNRYHTIINTQAPIETERAVAHANTKDKREIPSPYGFMTLCNGSNFQTKRQRASLHCFYDRNSSAYHHIHPQKIEVHNWEPYLIQIYDVVGDKFIARLKSSATLTLKRTGVEPSQANNYHISSYRASVASTLPENEYSILKNLKKKVGRITGLQVENVGLTTDGSYYASEVVQVVGYTFGGHFSEHVDWLGVGFNTTAAGERIATFMLYLNDVELGGQTAFPKIGVAITPVKGSALFFYNLFKNGNPDVRTIHGACPVLYGEKWIANKWIYHNANFINLKCALDPAL